MYKYLYSKALDKSIIKQAFMNLRKNKTKRPEIVYIDKHLDKCIDEMYIMLKNTKPCKVDNPELAFCPLNKEPRIIFEHGKTRKIYEPEIKEQWVHHIIALILQPILMKHMYAYSCGSIPGRGAHMAKRYLWRRIKEGKGIKYFAKADIRHFYNNIHLEFILRELRRYINDEWFLYLIQVCYKDFRKGIPLGYFISQWLANFLLEKFDQFVTKTLGFDLYIRYMDDLVIFSPSKKRLHTAIKFIKMFLGRVYRLKLKRNYTVKRFSYKEKGSMLDFMGFTFRRYFVSIRKSIKLKAVRTANKLCKSKNYYIHFVRAMLSFMGWYVHSDSYNNYIRFIKPKVKISHLKKIVSRRDKHDRLAKRMLFVSE